MTDQPDLRASHADRDRAVETLRVAAGDGRLSAEELDARLEAALTARTLGQLAELTSDLPSLPDTGGYGSGYGTAAPPAKDVLVIEQRGGHYVRDGAWAVPGRIELRPKMCDVLLDFTDAVITRDTLRIDTDMRMGKLIIVAGAGVELDTDGLTLAFSQIRRRGDRRRRYEADEAARPLRIEIVGTLKYGKLIERRARRRRSGRS